MNKDLPEICYSVSETTKEVIVIKNGEMGYYPVSYPWMDMTLRECEDCANTLNDELGILPEERMAMEVGSIFGWDMLGADPQTYLDQAALLSQKRIKARIKSMGLSILYPVEGDLYEYHLLGEKRCFFSAENLPKDFRNLRTVTIDGKELLAVKVQYNPNGTITMFPKGRGKTQKVEKKSAPKERREER